MKLINAGIELATLFEKYARRLLTGKVRPSISEEGIMTIPNNQRVKKMAESLYDDFQKAGVPDNILKTENDIKVFHHKIAEITNENIDRQFKTLMDEYTLFNSKKPADVFNLKGKKIDPNKPIIGGENIDLGKIDLPEIPKPKKLDPALYEDRGGNIIPTQFKDVTKETDEQIIARIKKQNKEAAERLKNKKNKDSEDPEKFAAGGVAGLLGERTGYAVGNQVMPQVDARMNLDYNTLVNQNTAQRDTQAQNRNPVKQNFLDRMKRSFPVAETFMNVAAPAINLGRGILGLQDPIGTPSMGDRMRELEATKGPTGSIGYEDYGLPVATPGGRFTGGLPELALSNPVDFALAGSAGRYGFSPEGRTDLKYDFTPDQDTGSTGNAILDFVNEGGVKAKVSDLLAPTTAEAAETSAMPQGSPGQLNPTPTPDAGASSGPTGYTNLRKFYNPFEGSTPMTKEEYENKSGYAPPFSRYVGYSPSEFYPSYYLDAVGPKTQEGYDSMLADLKNYTLDFGNNPYNTDLDTYSMYQNALDDEGNPVGKFTNEEARKEYDEKKAFRQSRYNLGKSQLDNYFNNLAKGGRAGFYQGGQAQIEPDLSNIGHGSDALMARNRLLTPGSQATTSTGLNYLLGEDNDTTRVPYKNAGPVILPKPKPKPKADPMVELQRIYDLYQEVAPGVAQETQKYLQQDFINKLNEANISQEQFMTNRMQNNFADGGRIGYNKAGIVSQEDPNKIIEKKMKEKLKPFIPKSEKEIKKEEENEMFKMVEEFKTLKKKGFIDRNLPFRTFKKMKEKKLLKNKLIELDLKYPDKKILDENGLVNKENAKEAIDAAIIDLEIEPIDGLKLQRSVNTEGEQSVTGGEYTMGNFNFSSPNLEEGILKTDAAFNIGDLNLTGSANTNDSKLLNSKLGFNYNGELEGKMFNEDGYRSTELDLNKTFPINDKFNLNLKGSADTSTFDGKTYKNSDLTPKFSYNDGILSADISKEILEGGNEPNLSAGVNYNNFYAKGNNLLSEDRSGVLGYQKEFGNKDGDLFFTAGAEKNIFDDEYTGGVGLKYKFAGGGVAGLLGEGPRSMDREPRTNYKEAGVVDKIGGMVNYKNVPHYLAKPLKGVTNIAEWVGRLPFAATELASDMIKKPLFKAGDEIPGLPGVGAKFVGGEMFKKFGNSLETGALAEKIGLTALADKTGKNLTPEARTVGDLLELGGEFANIGGILAAGKNLFKGVDPLKKLSQSMGKVKDNKTLEKLVDETLTARGEGRRDFNKLVASGGLMVALQSIGLGSLTKQTKKLDDFTVKLRTQFVNDDVSYGSSGMAYFDISALTPKVKKVLQSFIKNKKATKLGVRNKDYFKLEPGEAKEVVKKLQDAGFKGKITGIVDEGGDVLEQAEKLGWKNFADDFKKSSMRKNIAEHKRHENFVVYENDPGFMNWRKNTKGKYDTPMVSTIDEVVDLLESPITKASGGRVPR